MDREMPPFDRLVDEAWPAPHRVEAEGWIYRHAGGVTKRANSVLPLGARADLPRAVDAAEGFYAGLGLPCVFSVGAQAPPDLDRVLEGRGYRRVDPTLVMTASLAEQAVGAVPDVEIHDSPSESWLRTWWQVDGGRHPDGGEVAAREWAERILGGVGAGYASAGAGMAVGRGVPQGDWLGIYCMAVDPGARRRGLGGSVLRALLAWGRERGASRAYLVVTMANAGARALYEGEGFGVAGNYHYRIAP
ncbi:GNAT family N-acetyltransferase [Planotetraspora silvatica]|nr:GNAT family N-acetyltransferase [Planotetraspora silvatica]